MPPAEPVVEARAVSRQYGYRSVVREASLAVAPGEALLLTGPNGAGKTTLLRLLAGLLRPSSGRVARRGSVGLVAHDAMLYDALSARENLRFFARLHGLRGPGPVDRALELLGLSDRADDRAATFSRGMLQRLAIARALLPTPGLLLLDEPLSGLDAATVDALLALLAAERGRGTAMVIVSHQLAGLERVATHRAEIRAGALGPVESLAGG